MNQTRRIYRRNPPILVLPHKRSAGVTQRVVTPTNQPEIPNINQSELTTRLIIVGDGLVRNLAESVNNPLVRNYLEQHEIDSKIVLADNAETYLAALKQAKEEQKKLIVVSGLLTHDREETREVKSRGLIRTEELHDLCLDSGDRLAYLIQSSTDNLPASKKGYLILVGGGFNPHCPFSVKDILRAAIHHCPVY